MILIKRLFALALIFSAMLLTGCAAHHNMSGHDMKGMSAADHSKHQAMMNKKGYDRTVETYQIPDLTLTDQAGQRVSLTHLLHSDKPVIVNFIYATCTTICPLLSMGYVDLQRELGDKSDLVVLVSVTIDPEHDSPEVLAKYLKKFHGKPGWTLLTGTRAEVDQVTTAFDAFVADKMDHQPLNFILFPHKRQWVRLNGMLNGQIFLDEFKRAGYALSRG